MISIIGLITVIEIAVKKEKIILKRIANTSSPMNGLTKTAIRFSSFNWSEALKDLSAFSKLFINFDLLPKIKLSEKSFTNNFGNNKQNKSF